MAETIISAGHVCLDIMPVFPPNAQAKALDDILCPGKLIHMEGADVHTGGSVANTGLALKLLGNEVRLLGKIGCDAFGSMVKSIMASYGAGGLIEDPAGATSYSVVLSVPGHDRIFLHDPGANDSFCQADIPDEALAGAKLFHFGYPPLMKKLYENGGKELVELFRRVQAHGIITSLDFAAIDPTSSAGRVDWKGILRVLLPYVDFFVPSFEELCWMVDRNRYERLNRGGDMTEGLDLQAEAAPLAEEMIAMGCRAVLIKCGTSGLLYRTAGRETLAGVCGKLGVDPEAWAGKSGIQPCFRADCVRSATGAGDTSIAAFLTGVLRGFGPAECAALAAAEGACCVTAYDALSGIRPIGELMERIRAGWPTINQGSARGAPRTGTASPY